MDDIVNIELSLLLCVMGFIIAYVGMLGIVIHIIQKERDYYKEEATKYFEMWLDAMDE